MSKTFFTYDVVEEVPVDLTARAFKRHVCESAERPRVGSTIQLYWADGGEAYLVEVARVSELSMTVYVRPLRN